jgi:hypothetical protein
MMDTNEFELLLDAAVERLRLEANQSRFSSSKQFEDRVRQVLVDVSAGRLSPNTNPHPHVFPDICLGKYGIEVKFTTNDTWRSVANSVLESTRTAEVEHIYLMFGKMGGSPDVRWGIYEKCVMHVRTSHVPRFEVEIDARESLFDKMKVTYKDFASYSLEQKMQHIRKYARSRLGKGERLWWLEDAPGEAHTLPLSARVYMTLPKDEQKRLRAEAALLCPEIVKPGSARDKYNDAVLYILTYHGVLCPQARDLFSAGSAGGTHRGRRGGNYVEEGLKTIQTEMEDAALRLDDALFLEYWGESVQPQQRITKWLSRADGFARTWKPSEVLFCNRQPEKHG